MRRAPREQPQTAKPVGARPQDAGASVATRGARALAVVALGALPLLAACHAIFGPDDDQSWWYYCDESSCYRCNRRGCELGGGALGCAQDEQCPGGSCDLQSGRCVSNPRSCNVTSECASGYVCLGGSCSPGHEPCTDDAACGAGAYCQNGVCKDSRTCDSSKPCTSGFVCDERGSCVPDLGPRTCKTGSQCGGGLCLDGQCAKCSGDCGGGKTCQFGVHCGSGRACLDGQCTSSCKSDSDCGSAQQCKSKVCVTRNDGCVANSDCSAGQVCVDSTCHADCTKSGKCSASGDVCSSALEAADGSKRRICTADHAAKPECKLTKDCQNNEQCVNGVCRTVCTESKDCENCNDGPVCGSGGFCMTASENKPQCKVNKDCKSGQVCLDSSCTTL